MTDSSPASASYDVVIHGGGPAGCATALGLKQRDAELRVALVEKTDYSAFRVGETLPPPAQHVLMDLGVWDAFSSGSPVESHGTRAAWGSSDLNDHEFIFSPFGRGWHVDRCAFDALLAREAERAGVDVFRGATAQVADRAADDWTLRVRDTDGRVGSVTSRFVVDATGRRAAVATKLGAHRIVIDQLVGALVLFGVDRERAHADASTWVEATPHGWWYSAIVPDQRMVAIFMADSRYMRRTQWQTLGDWLGLASSAPHTARRVANGRAIGHPTLYPAASQRLDVCAGDGWLAVGDAACTFDPLSSQGVMHALWCGSNASRTICRHLSGDSRALPGYNTALTDGYRAYLDQRAAYYGLERRWPDSPFWQSRRELISLDPMRRLHFVPTHDDRINRAKIASRLHAAELQRLAEICLEPIPAHDAVARFKAGNERRHSDRDVVLALQALIDGGVLVDPRVTPPMTSHTGSPTL